MFFGLFFVNLCYNELMIRISGISAVSGANCDVSFKMFLVTLVLVGITSVSFFSLITSSVYADDSGVDVFSVMVPSSCTINGTVDGDGHVADVTNGTYVSGIGTTTMKVFCNDNNGFSVYAIGYSNNEYGNNKLIARINDVLSPANDINTGTGTNGTETGGNSAWAMKINAVTTASSNTTQPYAPTIAGETQGDTEDFTDYHIVPATYTKVATFASNTDFVIGSSIQSTYAVYAKTTQPTGVYRGQVKYTLVHPASSEANMPLAETIASRTKGVQTADELKAAITTANSGIFTYNAEVFGVASDASNDYPIYYYRGILDSDLDGTGDTYGSNGDGVTWPNYVKLTDAYTGTTTCWRIMRTTGSGGIKMMYNGLYGATTADSCANIFTAVRTGAINSGAGRYYSLAGVGYTYNPTYASSGATTPTAIGAILGTDANPEVNSADSTMKNYIENTWYDDAIGSYTDVLEPSAGYCNDRTVYAATGSYSASDVLSESTLVIPYAERPEEKHIFGSLARNATTGQLPSLKCPRSVVDLYTTSAATDGNGQLSKPVALATVDEASFAGSGSPNASNGSPWHANSYLRSASSFWTMSPYDRQKYTDSETRVRLFSIRDSGDTYGRNYASFVSTSYGVRPVISLKAGTAPVSGSGTAVDPWVVVP